MKRKTSGPPVYQHGLFEHSIALVRIRWTVPINAMLVKQPYKQNEIIFVCESKLLAGLVTHKLNFATSSLGAVSQLLCAVSQLLVAISNYWVLLPNLWVLFFLNYCVHLCFVSYLILKPADGTLCLLGGVCTIM